MMIFHSYVSLPAGNPIDGQWHLDLQGISWLPLMNSPFSLVADCQHQPTDQLPSRTQLKKNITKN